MGGGGIDMTNINADSMAAWRRAEGCSSAFIINNIDLVWTLLGLHDAFSPRLRLHGWDVASLSLACCCRELSLFSCGRTAEGPPLRNAHAACPIVLSGRRRAGWRPAARMYSLKLVRAAATNMA